MKLLQILWPIIKAYYGSESVAVFSIDRTNFKIHTYFKNIDAVSVMDGASFTVHNAVEQGIIVHEDELSKKMKKEQDDKETLN